MIFEFSFTLSIFFGLILLKKQHCSQYSVLIGIDEILFPSIAEWNESIQIDRLQTGVAESDTEHANCT
jgi:hypothetical protein